MASGEVNYSSKQKAFVYSGDESKKVDLQQVEEEDESDEDSQIIDNNLD